MPKTRSPRPKLNDTQLVILSTAAQHDDHSLLFDKDRPSLASAVMPHQRKTAAAKPRGKARKASSRKL